jgi:hypothetical protein
MFMNGDNLFSANVEPEMPTEPYCDAYAPS